MVDVLKAFYMYVRAMVLKLFHVEDPQIDTYQPTDPQLKRYARDPHIRGDFYSCVCVCVCARSCVCVLYCTLCSAECSPSH